MTNYERIKAMSVEEMAEHLSLCDKISLNDCDKHDDCVNCKLAWLNSNFEKGGEQELEFISAFDKWFIAEPSKIHFIKWRKWKKSRPLWSDFDKGGEQE